MAAPSWKPKPDSATAPEMDETTRLLLRQLNDMPIQNLTDYYYNLSRYVKPSLENYLRNNYPNLTEKEKFIYKLPQQRIDLPPPPGSASPRKGGKKRKITKSRKSKRRIRKY